jgi:hypothetical protein
VPAPEAVELQAPVEEVEAHRQRPVQEPGLGEAELEVLAYGADVAVQHETLSATEEAALADTRVEYGSCPRS